VVIRDENVARAVPSPLPGAPSLTFPAGERHKTRETWAALTDQMLAREIGRDAVVVAIGGGVTTDLAGFVAAAYLRGVPWIAVPTSTLGMIDAAVGGKTGVDTPAGKNLVGAFHQPGAVFCDPDVLRTLPEANFRDGLVEAIKHAAALDAGYGAWLETHAAAVLARDAGTLATLVHRSVELKGDVVADDEREAGRRAVLNAGHTVGHAVEHASGYALRHGEAVGIGLMVETRVAEALGLCEGGTASRIEHLLAVFGIPATIPPGLSPDLVLQAMRADKKNRAGVVRAALLASFGRVRHDGDDWTTAFPLDQVAKSLR
jgi:3-dehydroquinate synthase